MVLDDQLGLIRGEVGLVDGEQLRHAGSLDLGEDGPHGVDLALGVGRAGVDDMDEVVGRGGDLQRALERLDEAVGQPADESDGVREEHGLTTGQGQPPGGRVEGGEETVLGEDTGVSERVEQGRLSHVRVADDGHRGQPAAGALLALQAPAPGEPGIVGGGRGERRCVR